MMKWFIRSMLLLVLTASSTLHAWIRPQPGSWGIQGEFISLIPTIDNSYFAVDRGNIVVSPGPVGRRYNNDLNCQCAYRIALAYTFCDCWNDIRLVWTHLPTVAECSTASGDVGFSQGIPQIIAGGFSTIRSCINLEYWALDALYGFWGCQCNCVDLFFQAGLQYANLDFKEKIRGLDPIGGREASIVNKNNLCSVGPEVAFEMHYTLPYCQDFFCGCGLNGALSVAASARGALLAAKYDTYVETTLFQPGPTFPVVKYFADNENRWDIVPFWDIRIGLNYAMGFECFCASLEIGYEMFSYHKGIDRINFEESTNSVQSFDQYSDANFQGPYIALGVTF